MTLRRSWSALFAACALASMGASFRTQNFVVEAPNAQIAQQIGQYAEQYRKEKALHWLGEEMPPWSEPCPVKVSVTMNGSGGATSFTFDRGRVLGQHMHIEGSLDRLIASVLPHEVTHTVFAYHFRSPVPRWADEGGSVLGEDDQERQRHDTLVWQILNTPGRAMPMRRLLGLRDYPPDVMTLYAQGYSVTSFLVGMSSRPAFLNFVADGMRQGWDQAVQAHYRFNSVEELEKAWVKHIAEQRRPQMQQLASNNRDGSNRASNSHDPRSEQRLVRQTAPPVQPLEDSTRAVYRGVSASAEREESARPGASRQSQPEEWRPVVPAPSPSGVRLGPPEDVPARPTQGVIPPPPPQLGSPIPLPPTPGYPR
jgi:hypothetical protein